MSAAPGPAAGGKSSPPETEKQKRKLILYDSSMASVVQTELQQDTFNPWAMLGMSSKSGESADEKFWRKFETVLGRVNQYMLFEELGSGNQGAVYKCINLDDQRLYAIKVLERLKRRRRGAEAFKSTLGEIEVMKNLRHPNLVKLYEVIDDADNDRVFLIMDFVSGGSVMGDSDVLNSDPQSLALGEEEAQRLFFDFVKGMEYLHNMRIIHRDIKPSNMLIHHQLDGTRVCKVCDFGLSKLCIDEKSAKILGEDDLVYVGAQGTVAMMSPEALGNGPDKMYNGRPADVWSAGVSLYIMLTGALPFQGKDMTELRKSICDDPVQWPRSSRHKISLKARNLVKMMLSKDPEQRPTFSSIRQDEWFEGLAEAPEELFPTAPSPAPTAAPTSESATASAAATAAATAAGTASSSPSSRSPAEERERKSSVVDKIGSTFNKVRIAAIRRFSRRSGEGLADESDESDEEEVVVGAVSQVWHKQGASVGRNGELKTFGIRTENLERFQAQAHTGTDGESGGKATAPAAAPALQAAAAAQPPTGASSGAGQEPAAAAAATTAAPAAPATAGAGKAPSE